MLLPDKAAAKGAFTFHDKAAAAAMYQGIDALRKATRFLISGQTPVMAFDAPLFALTKFIQ